MKLVLPENPPRKCYATHDTGEQTPFRNRNVVVFLQLLDVRLLETEHEQCAGYQAENQTEKGKAVHAGGHAIYLAEDNWVCLQQGIGQSINEGHVK